MKKYVKIDGIHCEHCKKTISEALLKNKNISQVEIDNNIATINCNEKIKNKDIIKIINDLDYFTKEEYISDNENKHNQRIKLYEFLIIVVVVLLVNYLIYKIFGYNIFNVIPTIDSSITYGMLFVTGLLTSIHCISMCGAINLVAIYSDKNNIKKPIFYNLGRLISYTLLGGIVGSLGGILELNDTFKGFIIIIASCFMFAMSLKMLGIIDFHFKCFKNKKKIKTKNSFLIGILNGFMPCGPLQAMQVYALSTGSFFKGAFSMFLFCLGTIPLMLFIGILFNILKGKWKIVFNKVASVLILILSLVMLNRGLLYLNIDLFKNNNYDGFTIAKLEDSVQTVEFDLSYNNYQDIILQKGIPVKMVIHVDKKYLTGCNNEIIINEFNIKQELKEGDNVIEFTPKEEATITYTCWMNMIKNTIKVIDDKDYFEGSE